MRMLAPSVLLLAAAGCGHRRDAHEGAPAVHRDTALMLAASLANVKEPGKRLEAARAILRGMSDPPLDSYGNRLFVRATADGRLEVASAGPDGKDGTADDLSVGLEPPR